MAPSQSASDIVTVVPDHPAMALDRLIVRLGGTQKLDWARLADVLPIASAVLGVHVSASDVEARVGRCRPWQERLTALAMAPGIAQRTPAWYEARMQMITASDVAQALGCAKFGTQKQFFQKKCGLPEEQVPFDASIPPLKWGVMYEPVAQAVYAATNSGIGIYEFGLLRHARVPHLGASPDGITELGVMLEIKCPWRRKIQEGSVPLQYYYQMQMQLEVCDLDECDFFECEFFEVDSPVGDPQWSAVSDVNHRGLFAEVVVDGASRYVYPKHGLESLLAFETWLEGVESAVDAVCAGAGSRKGFVRPHWWVLRKSSTTRVRRDPAFVQQTLERTAEAWAKVESYRADRDLYLREIGAASSSASKRAEKRAESSVPLPVSALTMCIDAYGDGCS